MLLLFSVPTTYTKYFFTSMGRVENDEKNLIASSNSVDYCKMSCYKMTYCLGYLIREEKCYYLFPTLAPDSKCKKILMELKFDAGKRNMNLYIQRYCCF